MRATVDNKFRIGNRTPKAPKRDTRITVAGRHSLAGMTSDFERAASVSVGLWDDADTGSAPHYSPAHLSLDLTPEDARSLARSLTEMADRVAPLPHSFTAGALQRPRNIF